MSKQSDLILEIEIAKSFAVAVAEWSRQVAWAGDKAPGWRRLAVEKANEEYKRAELWVMELEETLAVDFPVSLTAE